MSFTPKVRPLSGPAGAPATSMCVWRVKAFSLSRSRMEDIEKQYRLIAQNRNLLDVDGKAHHRADFARLGVAPVRLVDDQTMTAGLDAIAGGFAEKFAFFHDARKAGAGGLYGDMLRTDRNASAAGRRVDAVEHDAIGEEAASLDLPFDKVGGA